MKRYYSSINWWLALFLAISLGWPFGIALFHGVWWLIIILGFTIAAIIHMYLNTYYEIKEESLIIRSGFFRYATISIASIKKVRPSFSPLASAALSLDRLEISYGKFDSVLISPKEKEAFIHALMDLNPEIQICV